MGTTKAATAKPFPVISVIDGSQPTHLPPVVPLFCTAIAAIKFPNNIV